MGRAQVLALLLALGAVFILYTGFRTKPLSHRQPSAARQEADSPVEADDYLARARQTLDQTSTDQLAPLEERLQADPTDVPTLESLAGFWWERSNPAMSAYYTGKLAAQTGRAESWTMAGERYVRALQTGSDGQMRSWCSLQGITALEKAISLDPAALAPRVQLALLYTEMPPQENPMKGILMLVDLNREHPEDVGILVLLGRLALRTGQTDKAVERLRQATNLEPANREAWCLLADAEQLAGHALRSQDARRQCENSIQ